VLDEVVEILVGATTDGPAIGEVARSNQEERGPPRAAPVGAVTGRAEAEVQSLGRWRAGGGARRVEEPRQPSGERPDRREDDQECQQRPAQPSSPLRGQIASSVLLSKK
jgi:hypothetical protein